jgi:transposase
MGGARKGAGAPKGKAQPRAKAAPDPDITAQKVEALAALGMNGTDIAAYFGTSKSTISKKYAAIIEKGRERLKVSLRQAQIKAALEGSNVMLIWLGKQLLGQSEKIETKNDHVVESKEMKLPAAEEQKLKELVASVRDKIQLKP